MSLQKTLEGQVDKEDEMDDEEFPRQLFGNHEHYERCLHPKQLHHDHQKLQKNFIDNNNRKDAHKQKEKMDRYAVRELSSPPKECPASSEDAKPEKEVRFNDQIPEAKLKCVTMSRFSQQRDEFRFLSERLDRVNMPKISERLTQILTERQRLITMLLELGTTTAGDVNDDEETEITRRRNRSNNVRGNNLGMPKKFKSVHWSDEHLGGSIVQDFKDNKNSCDMQPSSEGLLYHYGNSETHLDNSGDCKIMLQQSQKLQQPWRKMVYNEYSSKPPPSYNIHNFTLPYGHKSTRQKVNCDMQGSLCSRGIGHSIASIEDILQEAAVLRQEACSMLWRAHYLEQLSALSFYNHLNQNSH